MQWPGLLVHLTAALKVARTLQDASGRETHPELHDLKQTLAPAYHPQCVSPKNQDGCVRASKGTHPFLDLTGLTERELSCRLASQTLSCDLLQRMHRNRVRSAWSPRQHQRGKELDPDSVP